MMKTASYIFVSLTLFCFSCGRMVSDRESTWDKNHAIPLSSFPIFQEVEIDLTHEYHFDFAEKKIMISVNNMSVFNGNYEQLRKKKVKLPAPLSGGTYLISVRIIDPAEKVIYAWASDGGNQLLKDKLNQIELLYTGTKQESITLKVSHL